MNSANFIEGIKMVNASSFVRVTYWEGKGLSSNSRSIGYSPGHVALELFPGNNEPSTYISFWPATCGSNQCKEKEKGSHFHPSKDIDQVIEHSPGENTDLNTLDVATIQKAYAHFLLKSFGWAARGSSILRRSYERNCAGLTLYLLEAGDTQKKVQESKPVTIKRQFAKVMTSMSVFGLCASSFSHLRTFFIVLPLKLAIDSSPKTVSGAPTSKIGCFFKNLPSLSYHFFLEGVKSAFTGNYSYENYDLAKLSDADPLIKFRDSIQNFDLFKRNLINFYSNSTVLKKISLTILGELNNSNKQEKGFGLALNRIAEESKKISDSLEKPIAIINEISIATLSHEFDSAKGHYLFATAVSLAALVLTCSLAYSNKMLWNKTVTPADVNRIVKKMKQLEQTS